MSNPSPHPPHAQTHADDPDAQHLAQSLEQQLECIELNDPQSSAGSQEPRRKKLFARDLLNRLQKRRLEVSRINFTTGTSHAGKGSQGEVVVATLALDDGSSLESGNQVAVKKLICSENLDEEKFLRTFANEIHILDGLDHPNIIKLVGFVEDMKKGMAWLVFPWEANGNVREFLLSGKWELPERVSLIKDVAYGLEYLHTRQPPIRHGDLKSLNILVNSDHRAIITDFGSARIQNEVRGFETTGGSPHRQAVSTDPNTSADDECSELTVSATNGQLTLTGPSWSFRWAAPEILNGEEPCLASDIWALGWIAWEIVTDNYPFPEAKTNKSVTINVVMGRLPKLYDDDQLSQIGQVCYLMVKCWKPEPNERLSATECRSALQWAPSTIPEARGDGISQIRSAALLIEMGEMHRVQGRSKEAVKLFEEGARIARSAGDKRTTARALQLATYSYYTLSELDKAEECCNHSLDIYTAMGNRLDQGEALRGLGLIYEARSNHPQAEEYFNRALAMFKAAPNTRGRASALQGLANSYRAQSRYAKAEEHFKEALAIFTSIRDKHGEANTLKGLGEIYRAQSKPAEAEQYLNEALAIYTSIGESIGQGNASRELGQIYLARSDHAKAEEYFSKALASFTSVGSNHGQASALQGLGEAHQACSNYSKAESSYRQSLALYTSVGRHYGRTNSLLRLGEVLLRQARYSEAKSFLEDAAQVSSQSNYEWAQTRSKILLAEVIDAEGSSTEPPP